MIPAPSEKLKMLKFSKQTKHKNYGYQKESCKKTRCKKTRRQKEEVVVP
jgi:hypothetical protein